MLASSADSQRLRPDPVALVAAIGAALAWAEPVVRLGRVHPDEVFQALEPAYRELSGHGFVAWEWRFGLRNFAVVGLLKGALALAAAFGVGDVHGTRAFAHAPLAVLNFFAFRSLGAVARRRVSARGAALSVAAFALWPVVVGLQGRNLTESYSTAFLLLGFAALDTGLTASGERGAGENFFPFLAAGAAFGGALITRYTSFVFLATVPLTVYVALRSQARHVASPLGGLAVGFTPVFLALGALDALTWGRRLPGLPFGGAFHSFGTYLSFNVIRGEAARAFGTCSAIYYLPRLYFVVPMVAALRRPRPALLKPPLVAASVYVAALFLGAHKESRFLYPAFALAHLAAAPAIGALLDAPRTLPGWLKLAPVAAFWAFPIAFWCPFSPERSQGFRALAEAGRRGGVLVVGVPPTDTGGASTALTTGPLCVAQRRLSGTPTGFREPPTIRWDGALTATDQPCYPAALTDGRITTALQAVRGGEAFDEDLRAAGFVRQGAGEDVVIWRRSAR